jgi:hypothetical protein
MPKQDTSIVNAVAQYTQRQTRQQVKRLLIRADKLNGDRLARIPGAGDELRKLLDKVATLDQKAAHDFAVSIGWGDRIPA